MQKKKGGQNGENGLKTEIGVFLKGDVTEKRGTVRPFPEGVAQGYGFPKTPDAQALRARCPGGGKVIPGGGEGVDNDKGNGETDPMRFDQVPTHQEKEDQNRWKNKDQVITPVRHKIKLGAFFAVDNHGGFFLLFFFAFLL